MHMEVHVSKFRSVKRPLNRNGRGMQWFTMCSMLFRMIKRDLDFETFCCTLLWWLDHGSRSLEVCNNKCFARQATVTNAHWEKWSGFRFILDDQAEWCCTCIPSKLLLPCNWVWSGASLRFLVRLCQIISDLRAQEHMEGVRCPEVSTNGHKRTVLERLLGQGWRLQIWALVLKLVVLFDLLTECFTPSNPCSKVGRDGRSWFSAQVA